MDARGSPPHPRSPADPVPCAPSPQAFIKVVNYNHIMPTRYTLDLDLKAAVTGDATESTDKRVSAAKEAKKLLEERYKSGKNRCVRARLRGKQGQRDVCPDSPCAPPLPCVLQVVLHQAALLEPRPPLRAPTNTQNLE